MAIDYLPQEEVVQKQYFTWVWEFNSQYQNSNVNWIYKKIINQRKIRPADEMDWYLAWFDSFDEWTENVIWFRKREWFESCDESWANVILDVKELDWRRVYLVCDKWYHEAWIEVECNPKTQTTTCNEYWNNECYNRKKVSRLSSTTVENIVKNESWVSITPESFQDSCDEEYPFSRCTYWKLTNTYWPKWKPLAFANDWAIRVERLWNQLIYSVYSASGNFWNAPIWSWIYVATNNDPNAPVWFMVQVKWSYQLPNWNRSVLVDWPFPWLSSQDWDYTEIKWWYEIWAFPNRWNTLTFWTANWAVQIHSIDCEWYYSTYYWETYTPWDCNREHFNIESFSTFAWTNVFIANGVLNIAEQWNFFWQFTWANIQLSEYYNDFVENWQYWYLLWPSSMAIMYRFITWTWALQYQLITTDNWLWYFNKYAYYKHRWAFYIATSDDKWRPSVNALYVNPSDRAWGIYWFDIWYTVLTKDWVAQEFYSLNKKRWDTITMSSRWTDLLIFWNDWWDHTMLFIYDTTDKFWHTWNICWRSLKRYSMEVRYDTTVSINKWTTDRWNEIVWIKALAFWQASRFSPKRITWLYFSLNYDSNITNNSHIMTSIDIWWYNRKKRTKINSLYTRNIWNIKSLWLTDTTNREDVNKIFASMPMWLWLFWWNWIGKVSYKELTLDWALDQYCSYTRDWVKECIKDCDIQECTTKTNILNPEDNHIFSVARTWVNYMHIWDQCDRLYIEFVDRWTDDISLNWYMLIRQYIQRDNLAMDGNTLTTNNLLNVTSC